MKTVTTTQAKATLNALSAELERTGASVATTNRGRPVAARRFGQLLALAVTDTFDDPLPDADIAAWVSYRHSWKQPPGQKYVTFLSARPSLSSTAAAHKQSLGGAFLNFLSTRAIAL